MKIFTGDYINSNYAQYTYEVESPQHAVCIVGWDDNYKAQNFWHEVDENEDGYTAKDTIPPGDGAWLVKNSWGSEERDFPNKGPGWGIEVPKKDSEGNVVTDDNGDPVMVHSGYFWLSYYDKSMGNPEALAFEVSGLCMGKGERRPLAVKLPENSASYRLSYASSKPGVATVAADGTVTAVSKGGATITAESNGSKYNCNVRCIW